MFMNVFKRKIKIEQAEKLANQAFIFFIISALVFLVDQ